MESLPQPGFLFTIAMFALMIGPLVFVHEMGHYLVGRLFGTKVDSFSIGFGGRVAGWTDRRGTVWQLGWLPLGGYVKFAGDANAAGAGSEGLDDVPAAERRHYFAFKPVWQRALIVLAGPAINFLFAILIFAGFFLAFGENRVPPVIDQVVEGSAAAEAGLQGGDRITAIDGRGIASWMELSREVRMNPGQPMTVTYVRGGAEGQLTVVPQQVEFDDGFGNKGRGGQLGIAAVETVERRSVDPVEAVALGARETWSIVRSMADLIAYLVTGDRSVKELGGPVKIAQISGQVATIGVPAFISLMALISINLGFINLLPIPMLDGGHLALYAAEAARGGRPVPERAQQWAFMGGFALVVTFMVVVTVNDLASLGVWRHVRDLIG